MLESRLPCRAGARAKGLSALAVVWLLCGCGGDLAFTGGSIPPGGARLFGRVAAAENPLMPLAHVAVQVETRPITGGLRTFETTTASDGTFEFVTVPTGSTDTTMTVNVMPDPALGRQAQQIVFPAQNGVADDLVVALPLNTFEVKLAASLAVPDFPTLPPLDAAAVHALVLDGAGKRLPVQPTLLFAGNIGSIATDETFTATAPGAGTITAFWYALSSVTKPVVVDRNAPQLPPSPPDLSVISTSVPPIPVKPTRHKSP